MCCNTGMPCSRYRTWHPTLSMDTETGLTCRFDIHWHGKLHWKLQLPVLMSWVWHKKYFPTFSHTKPTLNYMMLSWWQSVRSLLGSVPYPPPPESQIGTCVVRIHYAIHSATVASFFHFCPKQDLPTTNFYIRIIHWI